MKTRLKALLKSPVSISITDNTHSIISVKREYSLLKVRLHHMFLHAEEPVIRALADFISGNKDVSDKTLKSYIKKNEWRIRKKVIPQRQKKIRIRSKGVYFDLMESFDRLNQEYFAREIDCLITWGNRRKYSACRTIRLGSYYAGSSLIRINIILDNPIVPQYVIDNIIYHEMLHNLLGSIKVRGRNISHHRIFKKKELEFIHSEKAGIWIKKNLFRLLG